jgi:membrane protein DedA with SNARE-associated domain
VIPIRSLLLAHGYAFLFGYILAVQSGLPIPADPLLMVMGALAGDHRYSLVLCLVIALSAALIGDCFWYELGRKRGHSILNLLCRLSLEPDTCVRKTETAFGRRGALTLLFAKFVPGMSLISMPLAGMTRMPRWRFLLTDAAGTALWAMTYLLLGRIFHKQVDAVINLLGLLGRRAGLIVILLLASYAAVKYLQRWLFLRRLRVDRIAPESLFQMIESGKQFTIVDLRHPADIARDGEKLAGAVVIGPDDLRSRAHEIPRQFEIVLYCT